MELIYIMLVETFTFIVVYLQYLYVYRMYSTDSLKVKRYLQTFKIFQQMSNGRSATESQSDAFVWLFYGQKFSAKRRFIHLYNESIQEIQCKEYCKIIVHPADDPDVMIGSKFWCWGGGFRAQLGNGRRRRGGGLSNPPRF